MAYYSRPPSLYILVVVPSKSCTSSRSKQSQDVELFLRLLLSTLGIRLQSKISDPMSVLVASVSPVLGRYFRTAGVVYYRYLPSETSSFSTQEFVWPVVLPPPRRCSSSKFRLPEVCEGGWCKELTSTSSKGISLSGVFPSAIKAYSSSCPCPPIL